MVHFKMTVMLLIKTHMVLFPPLDTWGESDWLLFSMQFVSMETEARNTRNILGSVQVQVICGIMLITTNILTHPTFTKCKHAGYTEALTMEVNGGFKNRNVKHIILWKKKNTYSSFIFLLKLISYLSYGICPCHFYSCFTVFVIMLSWQQSCI